MKNYRTSTEVNNSILKGLDEAIHLAEKIPKKNKSEKETQSGIEKTESNKGKKWSNAEELSLRTLTRQKVTVKEIGVKLGRTPGAIQNKAIELGLSF